MKVKHFIAWHLLILTILISLFLSGCVMAEKQRGIQTWCQANTQRQFEYHMAKGHDIRVVSGWVHYPGDYKSKYYDPEHGGARHLWVEYRTSPDDFWHMAYDGRRDPRTKYKIDPSRITYVNCPPDKE